MYVKKEMAFSMTLFHNQSFRMQLLELNFCDYHGYYSLTSSILCERWDDDIKMTRTDRPHWNPLVRRAWPARQHIDWEKWQNWLSHLLAKRFEHSVNGRQLATDFKLIIQSRLNLFLEWTVICTVGAIVRNGRSWSTGTESEHRANEKVMPLSWSCLVKSRF